MVEPEPSDRSYPSDPTNPARAIRTTGSANPSLVCPPPGARGIALGRIPFSRRCFTGVKCPCRALP
eukprot:1185163-Prorocentrum_minimum.AAC.3